MNDDKNSGADYRGSLIDALQEIKDMVCGEARPRWDSSPETTGTRRVIADICDSVLTSNAEASPVQELVRFVWTHEPPVVPGWYWCRWYCFPGCFGVPDVRIVEVFNRPGHKYLAINTGPTGCGKSDYTAVVKAGADWAGPILEPNAAL